MPFVATSKTFLFYDLETTGLNKAFDQILTFAGVRTDTELKVISRHTATIALRPDIIPSPSAIITNRISSSQWSTGECEFEAVGRIHRWINEPETISVGYNSLGFDDEFLRFSFYRNLLPVYTHQYRNGCRRMDILPMAIMFWLYKPESLDWPVFNGNTSMKLEHLAAANNLLEGPAHDASADAEATLRLARKLSIHSKMWQYLQGSFEKETDYHRAGQLPIEMESAAGNHHLGLMVDSVFGTSFKFQAPVLSLGSSLAYPNQSLWLRLDLQELVNTKADSVDDTTWVIRKRFGEPGILLPPLERYWQKLGAAVRRQVQENIAWLKDHREVLLSIADYYRNYRYPFIPNLDADAALYQAGFFPKSDEALGRKLRRSKARDIPALIGQFTHPEARALALRIIARNYPEHLTEPWSAEYQTYYRRLNPSDVKNSIKDYTGKARMTPFSAQEEIGKLRADNEIDSEQRHLLDQLESYIAETFGRPIETESHSG